MTLSRHSLLSIHDSQPPRGSREPTSIYDLRNPSSTARYSCTAAEFFRVYVGRTIFPYSDSLCSPSHVYSFYCKTSVSDTKLSLLHSFNRDCQVSTITLVYVPGHSGIWQNKSLKNSPKQALLSSFSVELNTKWIWFARTFKTTPPTYAPHIRIPKETLFAD